VRDVLLVLAVFLACAVEAVEALTVVLAVGVNRGWRSALQGVAAGLLALTVIVAALGPALTLVSLGEACAATDHRCRRRSTTRWRPVQARTATAEPAPQDRQRPTRWNNKLWWRPWRARS